MTYLDPGVVTTSRSWLSACLSQVGGRPRLFLLPAAMCSNCAIASSGARPYFLVLYRRAFRPMHNRRAASDSFPDAIAKASEIRHRSASSSTDGADPPSVAEASVSADLGCGGSLLRLAGRSATSIVSPTTMTTGRLR